MALPLYLAMTRQEMEYAPALPRYPGCFFPDGPGLCDLPHVLPPESLLILTDRIPWRGQAPAPVAAQIAEAAKRLECGCVLLDLEKDPSEFAADVAKILSEVLPCPLAAPPGFADDSDCAVFLPPCPLHVPLAEYLHPWQGQEVWLDVTMQQETITVMPEGTRYGSPTPADRQDGGWFDEILLCRCITKMAEDQVQFLLFDTPDTLKLKLEQAAALGVTKAVGLYQELYDKL